MRNLLPTAVPRPVFVTVVGIIVTGYAALCALMGPFVGQLYATTYPEHALLEEGRTREALLQQQLWAGLGVSVVCAAVALSGLAFLRLRTWGRVVIEGLGWLFAAYIAGGTVFMIVHRWDRWFAPLFGWPPGPGTVVMIIINLLMLAMPLGMLAATLIGLRAFRSDPITQAFRDNEAILRARRLGPPPCPPPPPKEPQP